MNTDETDERGQVAAVIAKQNDAYRQQSPEAGQGKWVWTEAVNAKGHDFLVNAIAAVKAYDGFTEDNDPYGTHEMGFLEVDGEKVWFRIDLYDETYEYGSPDPTSLELTRRVLTIMFPSDY